MAEVNPAGPSGEQSTENQEPTQPTGMDTQQSNGGHCPEQQQAEVQTETTSESDESSWTDIGHCEGCTCEKKGKEFDVSGPMKLKHWKKHANKHFGKHVMKKMKKHWKRNGLGEKIGKHGFRGCPIGGPSHKFGHGHGHHHPLGEEHAQHGHRGLGHRHGHHGHGHGHGYKHGHHGFGHHHGFLHHGHGPHHGPKHHHKGPLGCRGQMEDGHEFLFEKHEKKLMKSLWKKDGHGGKHGHGHGHGHGKHGHHHGFGFGSGHGHHGFHGFHGMKHLFGGPCTQSD